MQGCTLNSLKYLGKLVQMISRHVEVILLIEMMDA